MACHLYKITHTRPSTGAGLIFCACCHARYGFFNHQIQTFFSHTHLKTLKTGYIRDEACSFDGPVKNQPCRPAGFELATSSLKNVLQMHVVIVKCFANACA